MEASKHRWGLWLWSLSRGALSLTGCSGAPEQTEPPLGEGTLELQTATSDYALEGKLVLTRQEGAPHPAPIDLGGSASSVSAVLPGGNYRYVTAIANTPEAPPRWSASST